MDSMEERSIPCALTSKNETSFHHINSFHEIISNKTSNHSLARHVLSSVADTLSETKLLHKRKEEEDKVKRRLEMREEQARLEQARLEQIIGAAERDMININGRGYGGRTLLGCLGRNFSTSMHRNGGGVMAYYDAEYAVSVEQDLLRSAEEGGALYK